MMSTVKLAFVCPRMPDNVFGSPPPFIACVAKVCRRSWNRISGSSAFFRIVRSFRYAAGGFIGRLGFSGL